MFEDLLILGSATNQGYNSAPGDIRAFDVRSGKLVWTFHTVPRPGEFGYETWPPDAWKTVGGANAWGELTVDAPRGIVYVPTGSPKYNFYGANRLGANLFGDCLIALDARTGKRLWHFQMVHHDIWDYDNATAPKLLTVRHNGRMVDVVAQAGKTGFLYVFDRVTGQPLWPIEERPVPKSDMPGEQAWPTQPFPTAPPPFARQSFTEKDLSPYIDDPAEKARFLEDIRGARNEGLFTPPGLGNTVEMPGNNGGSNFGSAAADPEHGTVVVVSKDWPALLKLSAPDGATEPGASGGDRSIRKPVRIHDHQQRPHGNRAAVDVDDGVRPQRGDDQVEDPPGRGTGARRKRDRRHGFSLSEGRTGRDGWRSDLHRYARQEDPRLRRGHRQAAVDLRSRGRRRRDSVGVRSEREAVPSCTARLHRRPVTRIRRCIRPRVERATSQHLPAAAVAVAVAAEATSQARMWRLRYRTGDR